MSLGAGLSVMLWTGLSFPLNMSDKRPPNPRMRDSAPPPEGLGLGLPLPMEPPGRLPAVPPPLAKCISHYCFNLDNFSQQEQSHQIEDLRTHYHQPPIAHTLFVIRQAC